MTTRLPSAQVRTLFEEPKSRAWIKYASSVDDLKNIISDASSKHSKPLRFRSQTRNYTLEREINNPNLTLKGLGEVSLLPSLWRKMQANAPGSFLGFENLSLFDWSSVFYQGFDLEEIERQHKKTIDVGEWIYTMQEMADSDNKLLSEFGTHRLDLNMGFNYNLVDALATLLQHYGLLSPVLDLTDSLDVALFFATHKYSVKDGKSSYSFVGNNSGQSVIYVISHSGLEMVAHNEREKVLLRLDPKRPKRQNCVISRSGQYAINLPAYFLIGVIFLDFELEEWQSPNEVDNYFPGKDDDKFLAALQSGLGPDAPITDFG